MADQPMPPLPDLPPLKPRRPATGRRKSARVLEKLPPMMPAPKPVAEAELPAGVDLGRYANFKPRSGHQRLLDEIAATAAQLSKREREGLRLYEPLDHQKAFHQSRCRVRIARGSTRSGKTLCSAVDLGYACTRSDPAGRFPDTGVAYIVGLTSKHHGKVTYPKLFKPGSLKCIIDPLTGKWRAYRPWDEYDAANPGLAVDAEPLIPERFVDKVSWEVAKEEIPSYVKLTTGWELYFFSGEAKPPRGQAIDFGWIDEEINGELWYSELVSRCVDKRGVIVWSAAPQTGTQQLYELSEEADRQAGLPNPTVEEHVMKLAGNAHITDEAKREMASTITSEVERLVRIEGEYVLDSQKMYPTYALSVHGLQLPGNVVPPDWTRYLTIDPGHQFAVALFVAVPPPDEPVLLAGGQREVLPKGTLVLYDELYLPHSDAALFAERLLPKVQGQQFHRFVIDYRGSRGRDAGQGKPIREQYEEQFKKRGIQCRQTGWRLEYGSDDLTSGVNRVRVLLRPEGRHPPRLRVLAERSKHGTLSCLLPNWSWEIGRYRHKKDKTTGVILDEPDQRGRVHAMDAMRYAAMASFAWVPLDAPVETDGGPVWQEFQKKLRSAGRQAPVFGPAGANRGAA